MRAPVLEVCARCIKKMLLCELKLLFWGLFTWLDCQNDLLEDLLEVKTQEVVLLLSTEVNETEETDKGCHRNLTPKNQEDHIGTSPKRVL